MPTQGASAANQDGTLMLGVGPDGKMYPLSVGAAGADATATALGSPNDAAWSGTGPGTVIAILKKIALNTTTP